MFDWLQSWGHGADSAMKIVGLLGLLWAAVKFVPVAVRRVAAAAGKRTAILAEFSRQLAAVVAQLDRIEARQILGEQLQEIVLVDAGTGAFWADAHGETTRANRAYLRIVGRPEEEVLGLGWVSALCRADRVRITEAWGAAVNDKREFSETFSYETPRGELVSVRCSAYPYSDGNGRLSGFIGLVHPQALTAMSERVRPQPHLASVST